MSNNEKAIIYDELKTWEEALKDEQKRGNEKRINICKGGIQAINGLIKELGI